MAHLTPLEIIERAARELFHGEIAAVSSFGADSAVLLHMIAEIDRTLPVIFLDTGKHFDETLDYRDALVADFGLTNIRVDHARRGGARADRPDGQSAPDRHRRLLRRPQGRAAGARRRAVPRLVHRPQALPGRDAGGAAGVRGGRPAHPHQSAGALDDIRPGRLHARACAARKSAGRLWLSVDRLLPLHAAGAAGRGRAQRPLGRPGQDRVRHPPVGAGSSR